MGTVFHSDVTKERLAHPPSSTRNVNENKKIKNKTNVKTPQFFLRVNFGWAQWPSEHRLIKVDVALYPAECRWAVKTVDWWLDLRCGSRLGERMTHSVWCDVHPATARQCGGTPVVQPDRSVCSAVTSQTLPNTSDAFGGRSDTFFVSNLSGCHLQLRKTPSVVIYRKFRDAWLPWKQGSCAERKVFAL